MGLPLQTITLLQAARGLVQSMPADAVLLLTEAPLDWDAVIDYLGGCRLLVAAQDGTLTQQLREHPGLTVLDIDPGPTPTQERMSLALLEAVRTEKIQSGADVVAVYNGIDVGDTKKVLSMARAQNFNPFRGYSAAERDIRDRKVREQIKEIAQLDGAIIIRRDGVAVTACMYIDATAEGITLSKGLGARHWAAAAITRKTKAVAVAVSQSSGTVRVFLNGEIVLRIEPLARPMVFGHFRLEAQEGDGVNGASAARTTIPADHTAP
jgi:hypothetical protein